MEQARCLLVLDNVESILQDGNRGGLYQPGYEAYCQLFTRICDESHQSCLLITGRDKPGGFAVREGKNLPVRSLSLQGLSGADGQQILIAKGLEATIQQHRNIVNYFGGNPLALKIAATSIQTIFGGDVGAFLAQGNTVFSDLWDLIEQQFDRLSPLQQQIMYWLAINREGVTPAKLQEEILPKVSWRELLEALESLKARSLIFDERALTETAYTGLTLQPVIMEYVSERFIQAIEQEITTLDLNVFKTYALIEAQTQDYLRDAQIQLILHPLCERLLTHFETSAQLEKHLCQILSSLKHQTAAQTGYAVGNLLNLFCHLKSDLTGFDFSDLVIRQAYLVNATLHEVDFSNSQISQTLFAETFGGVLGVAYSPDGQLLATSDTTGDIQIWDSCTGEQLVRCRGHQHWTSAIAFSPDTKQLASSSFDRTVKLWDVMTGECLKTFLGHTNRVWNVAYHPNGRQIASGGDDHATKLWNLKLGRCQKTFKGHTNTVISLALSPDGNYLASGHEDQTVRLWDIKNATLVQTLRDHTNRVWSVAFQPATSALPSVKEDRKGIFQGRTNGRILASGSGDYTIKLWDLQLEKSLQTLYGHTSWVWSIAFHPNGTKLVSASYDQTVKLWDVNTGECLKTFQEHSNPVVCVTYSPDGKLLASSDFDGMIKLWNAETGECYETLKEHTNSAWCVTFSPNGNWLLSASFDQTLKLWDVFTGECLQTFRGHKDAVMVGRFSPDGQFIVSGSLDCALMKG